MANKKMCKTHPNKISVNSHFQMCRECNNIRLHGNPYGKRYSKKPNNKTSEKIMLDEDFYQKCFYLSDHKCEECGKSLPNVFRDDGNKVLARWRYSHILPKSTHPQFRHNVNNINHLCLEHHNQWDFGDRKSMKIYNRNKSIWKEQLK